MRFIKKIKYLNLIFILFAIFLSGCADKEPVSKSGVYFDTIVTITLYGEDEKYIDDCFELCGKYENLFSMTKKNSEISQINDNAGSYVKVSDDTAKLVDKGIYYGNLSGGRFDITIGAVSELWNFDAENPTLPSDEEIKKNIKNVDYSNIVVDNNNIMLSSCDIKLDLGGIAKGYIADKLKEYLKSQGVDSGIINLGGNILLIGSKPDDTYYNIGIKKPFGEDDENYAIISAANESIVSSGNYERYFYKDGVLYHHILDTSTGYPVDNTLLSVTILSQNSVDGDGLSTSCYAMGLEEGLNLIEDTDGAEAVFIDKDYRIYLTSGLEKCGKYNGILKVKRK